MKREVLAVATPKAVDVKLEPVEELFARMGVPAWQQAGLMRHKRWAAGKQTTEADLAAELKSWLNGPAARR
jgi:hypothetical protein